jgi:hypothetical protein
VDEVEPGPPLGVHQVTRQRKLDRALAASLSAIAALPSRRGCGTLEVRGEHGDAGVHATCARRSVGVRLSWLVLLSAVPVQQQPQIATAHQRWHTAAMVSYYSCQKESVGVIYTSSREGQLGATCTTPLCSVFANSITGWRWTGFLRHEQTALK